MSRDVVVTRWKGALPDADPARSALVLPGAAYPVEMPGLWVAMRALALAGWEVNHATWDMSDVPERADRIAMVEEAVGAVQGVRLVLGKSVGSLASGWAAAHDVPAIWLTPLLTDLVCVSGLERAAAPFLMLAGENDLTWDDDVAEALLDGPREVVRLGSADHGLLVGDIESELGVLRQVADAVGDFASRLVEHGLA